MSTVQNYSIKFQNLTVCEDRKIFIQCPSGPKIYIDSGWYGRQDSVTCPPVGGSSRCFLDITSILKANVNGRNAFLASMTNTFAKADPCVGTYKYSIIKYYCA